MILLDTHVWVWWVHGDAKLPPPMRAALELQAEEGLAVSAISCWEVAKLVERGRLDLALDLEAWFEAALEPSAVALVPLTAEIALASTRLPGHFHRDPGDQIIVATARSLGVRLATADQRIRSYPHVRLVEDARIHDR